MGWFWVVGIGGALVVALSRAMPQAQPTQGIADRQDRHGSGQARLGLVFRLRLGVAGTRIARLRRWLGRLGRRRWLGRR